MNKETLCIHAGYHPESGEARQIPIVQSTTFHYDNASKMGKLFDLQEAGYFYSRLQNPTNDLVAAKICELEKGSAAMLTSSGQAANFYAIFNIANCGDHVVCSSAVYGGTYNLFKVTMQKMGISFTFVDPECSKEQLQAAFQPNTKAVFAETLSNPTLVVLDIEMYATVAHENGVPLIIDNTFATPINCNPISYGADIVTHSTTKYLDGHGSAVGGCIVDAGKFDWMKYPDKFPGLCKPDDSYHGVIYCESFGLGGAYITKATTQLMRDFGAIQAPQNAYLLNLGIESLHVRIERHCSNALKIAEFLENHPKVNWVNYPGLKSSKYNALANKYMPKGTCGVLSFGIAGSIEDAITFMESLEIIAIATHVADAKSCCLHPASTTHRQLTNEQLQEAGLPGDLIRLSVGIENIDDLINDISKSLDNI